MTYKTILACLPTEHAVDAIMPAACSLARRFQSHLIGIHTLEAWVPYPGIAMHSDHPYLKTLNEELQRQDAAIRKSFDDFVHGETFAGEWRSLKAESPKASDRLIRSAFRSDLVVATLPDRSHERYDQFGAQKDLILNSRRPVLLVPTDGWTKPVGARVLLAWTPTSECAAAMIGALPLLTDAEEVVVLTVEGDDWTGAVATTEGHEAAAHLARHGATVTVVHTKQNEASIGAQIRKEADSANCDLIVMGAFGHSILHNLIFHDPTRLMLAEADRPILLGH